MRENNVEIMGGKRKKLSDRNDPKPWFTGVVPLPPLYVRSFLSRIYRLQLSHYSSSFIGCTSRRVVLACIAGVERDRMHGRSCYVKRKQHSSPKAVLQESTGTALGMKHKDRLIFIFMLKRSL